MIDDLATDLILEMAVDNAYDRVHDCFYEACKNIEAGLKRGLTTEEEVKLNARFWTMFE